MAVLWVLCGTEFTAHVVVVVGWGWGGGGVGWGSDAGRDIEEGGGGRSSRFLLLSDFKRGIGTCTLWLKQKNNSHKFSALK